MQSVAKSLPALIRAEKIQSKAAKIGFDFASAKDALIKLQEETNELLQSIESGQNIEEEMGDLLFSAVNISRLLKLDPENTLYKACDKFINRFEYVEQGAQQIGNDIRDISQEQLEKLWNDKKILEKNS